jgi:pimeloyl-ACP methyl ester carboxylesterase
MLKSLLAAAVAALTISTAGADEMKTGYVEANGVSYYYEISGEGEPLLLLHGGLGSTNVFRPIQPEHTKHRQVIAVDLLGHGRTELGDRRIVLTEIADDVAVVLRELGYSQVDVFGYSFGGATGFQLAVRHPEMVRRLAIMSAGFSEEGFFDDIRAQQVQMTADSAPFMKETPMYQSYMALAPKPEDFPRLLQGMGDWMREHYDWSADVKKLTMPTMIVFGDSDMYKPEHIVTFYQLLGGGLRDSGWNREGISQNRLAIIPNATHYDIALSPLLGPTVLPFLDGADHTKGPSATGASK